MGRPFKEIQVGAEKKGVREILSIDNPDLKGFLKDFRGRCNQHPAFPGMVTFTKTGKAAFILELTKKKNMRRSFEKSYKPYPESILWGPLSGLKILKISVIVKTAKGY
jgi:hypothetical protein